MKTKLKTALGKSRFVFISYSEDDEGHAETLIEGLTGYAIDTWAAFKNVQPGDKWDRTIEEAISQASLVCVIASENSIESAYVRAEVEFAFQAGKVVIPICIGTCKLPLRWRMSQCLNWRIEGKPDKPPREFTGHMSSRTYRKTLAFVIDEIQRTLPQGTRSEFVRLLETADGEESLKELIRTYYEWIPSWEIRSGRKYERNSFGTVRTHRPLGSTTVDISVEREDSSGDRCTYVYLGSTHAHPATSNQTPSPDLLAILSRAEDHMPLLTPYDGVETIIVFGRRRDWNSTSNEMRRTIEKEWRTKFTDTWGTARLTIMSYDRVLDGSFANED